MNLSRKARREIFFIFVFLSAAPLVYLTFFGSGGFLKVREYRTELGEIHRENQAVRQEVDELKQKIERIKNDPSEIERISREELNFAEPGDIIIEIPEPPK